MGDPFIFIFKTDPFIFIVRHTTASYSHVPPLSFNSPARVQFTFQLDDHSSMHYLIKKNSKISSKGTSLILHSILSYGREVTSKALTNLTASHQFGFRDSGHSLGPHPVEE